MHDRNLMEQKEFLSRVEEHFNRKNYRMALDIAQSRIRLAPGDLDARIVICRIWMQQGRIDEVREMICEMEEIIAGIAQLYACLGSVCRKKGLYESADLFDRKYELLTPGLPSARDESVRLMEIASQQDALASQQEKEEAGQVASDVQTSTQDGSCLRGFPARAQGTLEGGILHAQPQRGKASEKPEGNRDMANREVLKKRSARIVTELSRWLDNIGRFRKQGVSDQSPRLVNVRQGV
jgi:hypothetical protein